MAYHGSDDALLKGICDVTAHIAHDVPALVIHSLYPQQRFDGKTSSCFLGDLQST